MKTSHKITFTLIILILFLLPAYTNAATEFISSLKEDGSGDYTTLSQWEDAVETDLTVNTTRVFTGSVTGTLSAGDILEHYSGGTYQSVTCTLVATTTTQLLTQNCSSATLTLTTADQFRVASSTSNMFTVTGSGVELGDSPIAIAQIDGTWTSPDTTAVTIDDWTTSATNYIKIYTTAEARHGGVWDETKYRLEPSASDGISIRLQDPYIRLEGLQLSQPDNPTTGRTVVFVPISGDYGEISHNIIRGKAGSVSARGIDVGNTIGPYKIWNNIVYGFNGTGERCIEAETSGASKAYVYNNTMHDCTIGINSNGGTDIIAKNNLVSSSTDSYLGTFGTGTDYNSTDSSDAIGVGSNNRIDQTFGFEDESNRNLHIISSDGGVKDFGVNLSADPNLSFTNDIDGTTRSGTWDIGADEYVAPATTIPTGSPYTRGLQPTISNTQTTKLTHNSATISWNTPTPSHSEVYYGTTISPTDVSVDWTPTKQHSIKLNNLKPETTYHYSIRSRNNAHFTTMSYSYGHTLTTPPAPDTTPPHKPIFLRSRSLSSIIELSWSEAKGEKHPVIYNIHRDDKLVAIIPNNTYRDTNLTPNTTYTYTISTTDKLGNTSPKAVITSKTKVSFNKYLSFAPSTPKKLKASTISDTSVYLKWKDSTVSKNDTRPITYQIFRNGILITNTLETKYLDNTLTPGTSYLYTVSAYNTLDNQSPLSPQVRAKTFTRERYDQVRSQKGLIQRLMERMGAVVWGWQKI